MGDNDNGDDTTANGQIDSWPPPPWTSSAIFTHYRTEFHPFIKLLMMKMFLMRIFPPFAQCFCEQHFFSLALFFANFADASKSMTGTSTYWVSTSVFLKEKTLPLAYSAIDTHTHTHTLTHPLTLSHVVKWIYTEKFKKHCYLYSVP